MPDRRSRPADAHADRAAGENFLLNPGEYQRALRRRSGQPADDPQRPFEELRLIAGLGDVPGIGMRAAILAASLPLPRQPSRQFALAPWGVRIIVLADTRGDGSPAPFALQLALRPEEELRQS